MLCHLLIAYNLERLGDVQGTYGVDGADLNPKLGQCFGSVECVPEQHGHL
jgi:hypothetical protein